MELYSNEIVEFEMLVEIFLGGVCLWMGCMWWKAGLGRGFGWEKIIRKDSPPNQSEQN